ncbi:hypothetical protein [Flavobacterium sp. SM2513]|uniref:hypothetical protein n=1 Tax=Flavobacterium sp. SM2513 TaxID=3424766 RepID=UPI003D7FEDB0
MDINNANLGSIDSNGGNVQLGNNYITNVFEGLNYLLQEFKDQLKSIEDLMNSFKPKTALDLLNSLENRVIEIEIQEKNKILGKISFLKGLCKREINEFNIEMSAQDFLKSSKLNPSENIFRDRACVEYLNLKDQKKALGIAEDILKSDEYNKSAWYVKAVTAENIKVFFNIIPKVVFEDYNFRLSIISHIISTEKLSFLENLSEYNLELNIDFDKYKILTFGNLEAWRIAIDLSMNKVFNDYPLKYIAGEHFILDDIPLIEKVFNLMGLYISKLDDTEIKDSTIHQKFYYNYFGYLLTNKKNYYQNILTEYPNTHKPYWLYTFCICQLLNHNEDYETSLIYLYEYEQLGGALTSEFYLLKSALYHLNGKKNEIENVFDDYLLSIEIIEERNGFNIITAFLNILFNKVDKQILINQLDKIRKKEFKSTQIKELLEITIEVRYLKEFDLIETYSVLNSLREFAGFDLNWKNLIAENLNTIGRRNDAIEFLETYVDKSVVSESLRLFISLIHAQLCDKEDTERGRYDEILELLRFWRLNNKYVDETFLQYEHNLYTEINDLKSLEEIDGYLFNKFPDNKHYILTYLNILERTKNNSKILEVINIIPLDVDDEGFGVSVSSVLLRNRLEVEKGFQILYNLAINPNNTLARKNYFFNSLMFNEFFKKYDNVILDCWVSYSIANKIEKVKIEKEEGFQKEFLGKKVGDKFTTTTKLTGKIYTIEILEIHNDAVDLHHNIMEEANNPLNELGFESLQLPPNSEDFANFFKELFGNQGSEEKKRKDKLLVDYYNYRIGFSEISRSIFKENYIDAYLHLSGFIGNKFTTLPSLVTKNIEKSTNSEINFGLDFSTLILFYFLEKELDFEFVHKFTISYLIKVEIEKEIIELNNSPFSSMSIEITNESFRKYLTPENYKEKRQDFLESLLEWIDRNCSIDLVKEKLDLLPKFDDNEKLDDFMKLIVDDMCLCDRDKFHLISSDSTLFLFTNRNNTNGNIINPEKFLTSFYSERCNTDFYRFLLKSNYLGININYETLKNEFYDLLVGRENYYNLSLENLKYSIHNNPNVIVMASKFLKELYLMPSLTIELKNMYSYNLILHVMEGMPINLKLKFNTKVTEEFKLLGHHILELQKVFLSVVKEIRQ